MPTLVKTIKKCRIPINAAVVLGLFCFSVFYIGINAVGKHDAPFVPALIFTAVLFLAAVFVLIKTRLIFYATKTVKRKRFFLSLTITVFYCYSLMERFFGAMFHGLLTGEGKSPGLALRIYELLPFAERNKDMALKLFCGAAAGFCAIAALFVIMALFRFFGEALSGEVYKEIKQRGGRLLRLVDYLKRRPEAVIFSVLMFFFIMEFPAYLDHWSSAWFAMDYSMGFGPRFFIGSVVRLIFGEYIHYNHAYTFVIIFLFANMALVSYILGKVIRKSQSGIKRAVVVLAALYVTAPFSVAYLWTQENMGRLDTWHLFFSLLAVIVFVGCENRKTAYILMGFLSVAAVFTHHQYVFTYFSLMFSMMCMDIFRYDHIDQKALRAGVIILALTAFFFAVFQFFPHVKFSSAGEMASVLREKTNLYVDRRSLELNVFYDFNEQWGLRNWGYVENHVIERGVALMVMMSPYIYIIAATVKNQIRMTRRMRKNILYMPETYILASLLMFLPVFYLAFDWGRYFAPLFAGFIFIVFCFVLRGNKPCIGALRVMDRHIARKPDIYVLLIGLFLWYDRFHAAIWPWQARYLRNDFHFVMDKIANLFTS